MANGERERFPSPFEVEIPPELEGWEEMYPYYYLFSEERREFEDSNKLWFQDRMHHPEPLYPFDTITAESWWVALGQNNSRIYIVPPALGIDQRVLGGYLYISANSITDPEVVQQRVEFFQRRGGYYYEHWDELYAKWKKKAEGAVRELEALEVPDLPEYEDESVVTEGRGISSGYYLLEAWDRLVESCYKIWQYHFEFLNLGYAAYLTFFGFCKETFPGIADQTIARMVAGIDVILYRPDQELKNLAQKALDLGVAGALKQDKAPEDLMAGLSQSEAGKQWLDALEAARQPWFNFSTGTGFYHHHRSWNDDLAVPFAAIRSYIEQLEQGNGLDRPLEEIRAERERLAEEYTALLDSEESRKAFQDLLQLARTVYPYVEEHGFYVENWHHSIMWNKVREFGRIFVKNGFFKEVDDIFYLHRFEINAALYDMVTSWAVGTPARGPGYWPLRIEQRKAMIHKMKAWNPPPALGVPPDVVTEPFTIILWGVTTDTISEWLKPEGKPEEARTLKGFAGSPGVVEGPARVIRRAEELDQVQDGEILVCPITTPSWAPVFPRIKAAVTDIGGMMSHAAIVCREYGVPAVVGTGYGTQRIETGQQLRVDGNIGTITILG
jgi:pyruvate,water dikinase